MAPNTRVADVLGISAEDVLSSREEPDGSIVAVTADGYKVRVNPAGEPEIMVGPGRVTEVLEPVEEPEAEADQSGDLPALEEQSGPGHPEPPAESPQGEEASQDTSEASSGQEEPTGTQDDTSGEGEAHSADASDEDLPPVEPEAEADQSEEKPKGKRGKK